MIYSVEFLEDNLEALPIILEHMQSVEMEYNIEVLKSLISNLDIFISRSDSGTIVGYLAMAFVPHPFSGRPLASEYGFYCKEGQGRYLLQAAEEWTRLNGVETIVVNSYHTKDMTNYYGRKGYKKMEVAYKKDLI